jgi:SAM-dependent methyltransferase
VTRPLRDALAVEGVWLIGADLSYAKLGRLTGQTKENPISLVQADARRLPFPTARLDAIITIRVLHLIARPELALQEFHRLLKSDGVYVRLEEVADDRSIRLGMRARWQELLQRSGLPQRHSGRSGEGIDAILQGIGARNTTFQLAQAQRSTTAGREIERIAARVRHGVWSVPAGLLPALLGELKTWAKAEYGSLERELSYRERAVMHVWRF